MSKPIISRDEAREILFEHDPTLSVESPIKFEDAVSDIVSSSKEPTFSRVRAVLCKYSPYLQLAVQERLGLEPDISERVTVAAHIRSYVMGLLASMENSGVSEGMLKQLPGLLEGFAYQKIRRAK